MDQYLPISCSLTFLMLLIITVSISAADRSQRSNQIPLGSSMVAGDPTSPSWKSHNGDFAFGFHKLPTGRYLLAIMFDKLPNKTIVWSANRNNPVEQGSKAQLSAAGLVLTTPTGQQVWPSTVKPPGVAYGAMLDSGNFLLATSSNELLWQSFDEPTDTLLPGQILVQNSSLFSGLSETDYSRGQFELIMQSDGNLVMYTLNYPMADVVAPYWASNTYLSDAFQVVFNESGYFFLTARNGTVGHLVFSNTVPASKFYQRLTLGFDGVLRHYSYPKSGNSTGEWAVQDYIPLDNICLRVGGSIGGGVCGYNSVCSVGGDDNDRSSPVCSCPERYSLLDSGNPMGGCEPDFPRQRCHQNSTGSVEGFELEMMVNTEWKDSAYDYFKGVTEDWCKQSCHGDCFCDVAFFAVGEGECWKNAIPLRHGRVDTSRAGKSFVKVPAKK